MSTPDWMDRSLKIYDVHHIDGDKAESIEYEPRGNYSRCDECLCRPCECTPF